MMTSQPVTVRAAPTWCSRRGRRERPPALGSDGAACQGAAPLCPGDRQFMSAALGSGMGANCTPGLPWHSPACLCLTPAATASTAECRISTAVSDYATDTTRL